jgi:hypothetical protein
MTTKGDRGILLRGIEVIVVLLVFIILDIGVTLGEVLAGGAGR